MQQPFDDAKRQWPVGQKLTYAQKLVDHLKAESLVGLSKTLKEARLLFERRNTIVHGRIYASGRLSQISVACQINRYPLMNSLNWQS